MPAGFSILMRNLGGSVGIALVTTFAARRAQVHQSNLVGNLTPYDPGYQSGLQTLSTTFAANGDPVTAHSQAVGSMYHTLLSQASLLAYLDNFRLFAGMCVVCLVGALLLKM